METWLLIVLITSAGEHSERVDSLTMEHFPTGGLCWDAKRESDLALYVVTHPLSGKKVQFVEAYCTKIWSKE
jgi:hypothetical protein